MEKTVMPLIRQLTDSGKTVKLEFGKNGIVKMEVESPGNTLSEYCPATNRRMAALMAELTNRAKQAPADLNSLM